MLGELFSGKDSSNNKAGAPPISIPFPILGGTGRAAAASTLGAVAVGAGAVVVGPATIVSDELADYQRIKGQEQLDAIESEVALENVLLAQNTAQQTAVVIWLLATATEHLGKLGNSDPNDPNRNHWKKEVKAALDRAKRIANRLPTKVPRKVLGISQTIF